MTRPHQEDGRAHVYETPYQTCAPESYYQTYLLVFSILKTLDTSFLAP